MNAGRFRITLAGAGQLRHNDAFTRQYFSYIHALVAEGVFLPSGTFRVLPPVSEHTLCQALRLKVLDYLCAEGVLNAGLAQRMLKWHHSGFSVHNRVRSKANDAEGRQRLARYMIRSPRFVSDK